MSFFLAIPLLLYAQRSEPPKPNWDKIKTQLQARLQGEDIKERIQALKETIATNESRAFDLLFDTLKWVRANLPGSTQDLEQKKKAMSQFKEQLTHASAEREALAQKKRLSPAESQHYDELNQKIQTLSKTIEEGRGEIEKAKDKLNNLQQMDNTILEGSAAILKSTNLYEPYEKALARSLDFPGDLQRAVIFVQTLARSGRKEASPALLKVLQEAKGSEALFQAAAQGVATLDSARGIPNLIELLGHQNGSVRKTVYEALKAATHQSFPAEKSLWQKWWNEKK